MLCKAGMAGLGQFVFGAARLGKAGMEWPRKARTGAVWIGSAGLGNERCGR
jgi:hypothetical protein